MDKFASVMPFSQECPGKLFVDCGNGFNEEDVVIGESNANGTEMYFNLSNYKNIKNFANCKCKLNTLVK